MSIYCNILDLGEYGHCDEIVLTIVANVTDMYWMEYKFLGVIVRKQIAVLEGDNIKINGTWFNETAEVVLRLYNSLGESLNIDQLDPISGDVVSYEEFKIKFTQRVGFDRLLSDYCYCA